MEIKRKLVSVKIISKIDPIPGAEKIEVATVGGWKVVIAKEDNFIEGQKILFYEIDSFLPVKPEYDFLLRGSKPKKMLIDGKEIEGIRLKTIKLRGQLSQGLILPIPEGLVIPKDGDVSEQLCIIKYEAPIPASLSGIVKGSFPSFIPKTDEERIQNMSEILNNFYVSEKIDGTSVTYYKKNGLFGVCSRNLELCEGETTQWKIARKMNLQEKMPDNFALQGELVGEGIQSNPLKIKGQEVYFFNAYNIESGIYLNYEDFIGLCKSLELKNVPIIDDSFTLPKNVDELLSFAEGKSLINPDTEREGIVIRPKIEMVYKGQRFSFKAISNLYLLEND